MRHHTLLLHASAALLAASLSLAQAATTANPAPTAGQRAASDVGNEIDKAVGPNRPISSEEMSHAVSLSSIKNPAQALATAQIKNRRGQAVGTVSAVDVARDGTAEAIHADVGGFLGIGEHRVAIKAGSFSYLKSRDLLVTSLTRKQIEALTPERPPHG